MNTFLKTALLLAMSFLLSTFCHAQTPTSSLLGRWLTEDKTTVEFTPCGGGVCAKQIAAEKEKDKKDNGKVMAQDVTGGKDNTFAGQVIDPSNGKSYKSAWILSPDGKTLTLKVKWGIMNFNEDWKRIR